MKLQRLFPLLFILAVGVRAEAPKSYQFTGQVIALTDNVITVQKGDEKSEFARSSATKVDGKLAVGNKVTVYYTMSAGKIEVKDAPAATTNAKGTEKADAAAKKAADKAANKPSR